MRYLSELQGKLSAGEIVAEEFAVLASKGSRDVRFHGTAVFLRFKGKRYLVTARHVLWDKIEAERELFGENDWPGFTSALPDKLAQYFRLERARDQIFSIIFRVPSIDEVLHGGGAQKRAFLMNLGAGPSFTVPYTFSDSHLDLAVVSLDQRDSGFADELEANGYVPIEESDIAMSPSGLGAHVFAVGFPSATSTIGQIELEAALKNWGSAYVSEPVFSFGRVAMIHDALQYFWADMSIYPGNSGGGVVEGDKLVGIVSAQAVLPLEGNPELSARIPFGKITKTAGLIALLDLQIEKDGFNG
ncbi:MAG: trypsin-like peptidase domain-containing protein [Betaproteobacteria bacterium]|nr:trypsin-like peptidase domain-containing protein [Betaproteobacteria bacterium]